MELYIKAGPNGVENGDCPFAHFVMCMLEYKNLKYQVIPRTRHNKPDWLVNDHGGKMPCLRDGDVCLVESSTIANYINTTYPEPKLHCGEEVESATSQLSGFFPSMKNFIVMKEFEQEKEAALLEQCSKIIDLLEKSKGPFLFGQDLSILDLSLGPKLYHLKVTVKEFFPDSYDKIVSGKLSGYVDALLASAPFASTCCPPKTIVWGWSGARGQ